MLLLQVDIFCRTGILHKLLVELLKRTPGKWGDTRVTRSLNLSSRGDLGLWDSLAVLWADISQREKAS